MHQWSVFFLVTCVVTLNRVASSVSIIEAAGGRHAAVRKVVPEGSQVSLQCRVPANSQLSRMMDRAEPPSLTPTVIWLRFDRKDPSSQEVISHGDTLLVDTNPRLRLAYVEETRTSTLTIDKAQVQDGGFFQCQVFVQDDVVPSSPIEVVIMEARSSSSPSGCRLADRGWLVLFVTGTLHLIRFALS